jgi:hypothetical protein
VIYCETSFNELIVHSSPSRRPGKTDLHRFHELVIHPALQSWPVNF